VNLSDLNAEIADLRSMISEVVDEPKFDLNSDAVAVAGASYGGGHSWLALVKPTFQTPKKNIVRIRAVVPIAPWTDLLYALLPNGRPNHSIAPLGGLKLSYVNGLYGSGIRKDPERPYPNYPDYLIRWHVWLNASEPSTLDPTWRQIVDGVAGYRSIWWQQAFWMGVRSGNRVPIFQVQGLTDDLFPLPEAKRMLLALQSVDTEYPITSYFGDLGHPRATNQEAEIAFVLNLIEPWLAYYLKGLGTMAPRPMIYISRTDEIFNAAHVRSLTDWSQLASATLTHEWINDPTTTPALVNPVTFVESGVEWDPFVMAGEELLQQSAPFPVPVTVGGSLNTVSIGAGEIPGSSGSFTIAGQPTVTLDALVKIGHRVQINVRLIDVAPGGGQRLITRGTVTLESLTNLGAQTIEIPTYGNRWLVESDHRIRLEISNVDSPYITPSREPSATVINKITLRIPVE
jgi:hypothetical protein